MTKELIDKIKEEITTLSKDRWIIISFIPSLGWESNKRRTTVCIRPNDYGVVLELGEGEEDLWIDTIVEAKELLIQVRKEISFEMGNPNLYKASAATFIHNYRNR